jgi:hypothetical protein
LGPEKYGRIAAAAALNWQANALKLLLECNTL